MLAKADVFIQNLKPGAIGKLGFAIERLRRDYPKLICCSISGFGETGPYAARKSYDLLVQAESGLASVTGGPEAPARVGVSVTDIASGMNAYEAVLEAIIARGRTGAGRDDCGLAVRRHGGLDDRAAAASRGRPLAQAARPVASLDRALRRVQDQRRRRHPDLDPERPRVARARRRTSWATRRSPPIRISRPSTSGVKRRAETDGKVAAVVRRAWMSRRCRRSSKPPTSRSRASTTWRASSRTRTCAASASRRRAARCRIRRRRRSAISRAATGACRRWASIPRRCGGRFSAWSAADYFTIAAGARASAHRSPAPAAQRGRSSRSPSTNGIDSAQIAASSMKSLA